MTLKMSFSDRMSSRGVSISYVSFTIKRMWPAGLLFFIIFFFTMPVPAVLSLSSISDPITYTDYYSSFIPTINGIFMFTSVFSAVFAGCYALRYLQSRVSINFYHSLPETRLSHYTSALAASTISYILSAVINELLLIIVTASAGFLKHEMFSLIFRGFGACAFYFFVFLSITIFAGILTGLTSIQFLMTGYLVGILPVIYGCVMLILDDVFNYFDISSLSSMNVYAWLTPIVRATRAIDSITGIRKSEYRLSYFIFDLLIIIGLFIGSYYIYKNRKSERSGTPIIFPRVASFIKYTLLFPATYILGFIFGEIGSYGWLYFGFAAGALLSFMLINTVFNRTAKAMFVGFKGLIIYFVLFITIYIAINAGTLRFIDYAVPQASEIQITADNRLFTIKDKATIEKIRDQMKDFNKDLKDGKAVPSNYDVSSVEKGLFYQISVDKYNNDEATRTVSPEVTYINAAGMKMTYDYYGINYSYFSEIFELIRSSENFALQYIPSNTEVEEFTFYAVTTDNMLDDYGTSQHEKDHIDNEAGHNLSSIYLSYGLYKGYYEDGDYKHFDPIRLYGAFNVGDSEYFNRVSIGNIDYRVTADTYGTSSYRYRSNTMPLYFDNIDSILSLIPYKDENSKIYGWYGYGDDRVNFSNVKKFLGSSLEDYLNKLSLDIGSIIIVNKTNENMVTITDKGDIAKILASCASVGYPSIISDFTVTHPDYVVFINYGTGEQAISCLTWLLADRVGDISDIIK